MSIICPTVTAYDEKDYRAQMERVTPFAKHIHIDLMDGKFAPTTSPDLVHIWWPHDVTVDIHLMYQRPMDHLDELMKLKPRMVVIHNEADVHHMHFAAELHKHDILAGLALLQDTPVNYAEQIMHSFDQVLIFSGHLGYHGGQADLSLLEKVQQIRMHHPTIEVAWDGGINDQNIKQFVDGGVDILNVGGYVQRAENPQHAYDTLIRITKGL